MVSSFNPFEKYVFLWESSEIGVNIKNIWNHSPHSIIYIYISFLTIPKKESIQEQAGKKVSIQLVPDITKKHPESNTLIFSHRHYGC